MGYDSTIEHTDIELEDQESRTSRRIRKWSIYYLVLTVLIAFVFGVLTIIYGYNKLMGKYIDADNRNEDEGDQDSIYETRYGNPQIYSKIYSFLPEYETINLDRNAFAELSLFAGMFAILTGFLGAAALCWRKPYFTCPFAVMAGTIGIVLMIAGILSLQFGKISETIIDEACGFFGNKTDSIRNQYTSYIDGYMCSEVCPCWSGYQEIETVATVAALEQLPESEQAMFASRAHWAGYKGMDEATLNSFGRSRLVYNVALEGAQNYSTLVWRDFKFDEGGKRISYDNFIDCLKEALIPGEIFLQKGGSDAAEFFKRDGLFTYLAQMEKDYECNSLCETNLFPIGRPLSELAPKKECLQSMADSWDDNINGGASKGRVGAVAAILAGIFMFLAMFASYPLCGGFTSESGASQYKYEQDE